MGCIPLETHRSATISASLFPPNLTDWVARMKMIFIKFYHLQPYTSYRSKKKIYTYEFSTRIIEAHVVEEEHVETSRACGACRDCTLLLLHHRVAFFISDTRTFLFFAHATSTRGTQPADFFHFFPKQNLTPMTNPYSLLSRARFCTVLHHLRLFNACQPHGVPVLR